MIERAQKERKKYAQKLILRGQRKSGKVVLSCEPEERSPLIKESSESNPFRMGLVLSIGVGVADALATLNPKARVAPHLKGGPMNLSLYDALSLPDGEKTREALQAIYGSASQPPLLTNILALLLEHSFAALCRAGDEGDFPGQWAACADAELLTTATHDPIVASILEQDASLRDSWNTVRGFAHRCSDAYQQGRTAARLAFPHFPRHSFNALQQDHLAHLLSTWRYNFHEASTEAQRIYPGYTPEAEQAILLRWFRRGYLFGSQNEPEDAASKKTLRKW